jgi:hypothetical protein
MPNFLIKNINNKFFLSHLIISTLIFLSFNPLFGGDTGGYTGVAKIMSEGTLQGYDWARTPGYPLVCLFFSLFSFSKQIQVLPDLITAQLICIFQFLFLLYSIYFLYDVVNKNKVFKYPDIVFLIFSPVLVIYSRFILPESLSMSIMILITANLLLGKYKRVSILTAALIVLKPNFLPFSLIIVTYISYVNKVNLFKPLFFTCLIICSLNYLSTDKFSLTNLTGVSLSQSAFNLFSKVHEEDKVIGKIFEDQYQFELANNNLRADIWARCIDKARASLSQMPFKKSKEEWKNHTSNLSSYIGYVSKYLIIENPNIVLKNSILIFPQTFDYHLPIPTNGVEDPKSIDEAPAIKSFLFFKKLFIPLEKVNHIFLKYFEIFCIFLLFLKLIKSYDYFYFMLLAIILGNKLMISFFGGFDTRYNYVIFPLLPLAFFYSSSMPTSSKIYKSNFFKRISFIIRRFN